MLNLHSLIILHICLGYYCSALRMLNTPFRTYSPFTMSNNNNNEIDTKKKVLIAGATGYIGKYVARESIRRGYDTYAIIRPNSKPPSDYLQGAKIIYCDVTDPSSLANSELGNLKLDVIISCLASRSGVKSDSYAIDYQATANVLRNGLEKNQINQFILLSAFCVQKPLLQFQKAKLLFEKELIESQKQGKLEKYSIVRPTAFFKSVSGQFEILQQGWPFVMFGNGEICKCNPIAESDLAEYMINCIHQSDKWNQILNIGGPDEGMTMKQQGDMLFQILEKEPKFIKAPIEIFDYVIGFLSFLGKFFPNMEDAAELGRIGKYYAVEDMLTSKPTEKYGKISLRQHYERIKVEGQEYDPYTTVLGSKKSTS